MLAETTRAVAFAVVDPGIEAEGQRAVEEYDLKAAFLFNIAKFAEWPSVAFAGADSALVVAIAGRDPFGPRLDQLLRGQTIHGRPFRVDRVASMGEVREAHIAFINGVPLGVHRPAVLTVGDAKDFCRRGGMIALRIQKDRLAMEVNLGAVQRAGLKLSAQLLKLATITGGSG